MLVCSPLYNHADCHSHAFDKLSPVSMFDWIAIGVFSKWWFTLLTFAYEYSNESVGKLFSHSRRNRFEFNKFHFILVFIEKSHKKHTTVSALFFKNPTHGLMPHSFTFQIRLSNTLAKPESNSVSNDRNVKRTSMIHTHKTWGVTLKANIQSLSCVAASNTNTCLLTVPFRLKTISFVFICCFPFSKFIFAGSNVFISSMQKCFVINFNLWWQFVF